MIFKPSQVIIDKTFEEELKQSKHFTEFKLTVATKTDLESKANVTDLDSYQIKGDYATKEEVAKKADSTELEKYQPKGDYITSEALEDKVVNVDLSKYQPKGDYATKEDISVKAASAVQESKEFTQSEITKLIGGASEAYDTLKEIEDFLKQGDNVHEAINTLLGKKPNKYSTTIGDGELTEFNIKHDLKTKEITASVWTNTSPSKLAICDMSIIDDDNIKMVFEEVPIENFYRVIVIG